MTASKKPTRDELIKQLSTPGWDLHPSKSPPVKNRTLEEQAREAHARHIKGEDPGIIKKIEAAIEVDLVELQELWAHLGLPM